MIQGSMGSTSHAYQGFDMGGVVAFHVGQDHVRHACVMGDGKGEHTSPASLPKKPAAIAEDAIVRDFIVETS